MKTQAAILTFLALAVLTAVGCSRGGERSGPRSIHVLNWTSYIGRTVIHDFEQESQISVDYETYSSNDEMLNLLRTSASVDVVFPSDSTVNKMIEAKLLAPLDLSKLTNLNNLEPNLRRLPADPENHYCVPYNFGMTGFGVNMLKVTEPTPSWRSLWNGAYKKKISLLNEPRDGFIPALRILGYSINETNPDAIAKATELMIAQKSLLKGYISEGYIEKLKTGELWLAQGYSGDVLKLAQDFPYIKYIVPKEGAAVWVDCICIPNSAVDRQAAHDFINYLLRADVAAKTTNETGFATANAAAKRFINPNTLRDPAIYPPDQVMTNSDFIHGLGGADALYENAWAKIINAPVNDDADPEALLPPEPNNAASSSSSSDYSS